MSFSSPVRVDATTYSSLAWTYGLPSTSHMVHRASTPPFVETLFRRSSSTNATEAADLQMGVFHL